MRPILILLFALSLTSCFNEDDFAIEPIPIPEIKIPNSINTYQSFFRLQDTIIVSYFSNADWDLGFESTPSGYHVILNTSKFMFAGNTGLTDFSSVTSNVADTMIFDTSSGNIDSTAIGKWADFSNPLTPIYPKNVYIINRGTSESGTSYGFKKIVFEKLENGIYYIHYANLDNSDEHYFQITKNPSISFVQFSFDDGGNIDTQQPNKDLWDLKFTKYSTILYDNGKPVQYPVRGVLINSGISVAKDTKKQFYSININDVATYSFSTKQDIIGYDWKIYVDGIYSIIPNLSYIIKDRLDNYYKIRFTGYKNGSLIGYPSFEMEKLNN